MAEISAIGGKTRAKLCILASGEDRWPGRLHMLSALGAFVETTARPAVGEKIALVHPEVGGISGKVSSHGLDGVGVEFVLSEESSAFALAVTAQDMTLPAAR